MSFSYAVKRHIDEYAVPQYGDEGSDLASSYDAEDCIKQANKYLARFGKNSRAGQEQLDLKKAAHYIQMAHDLLGNK
jgi:hypothetical protein